MNDPLLRAFRGQARACAALGSPFMERLMDLFAARLGAGGAVADRLLAWEGNVTSAGQSVPLRIAGALHGLVLDGAAPDLAPDLAAVYPPQGATDDTLWHAVAAARITHEDRVMTWLDQAPQTNEVRRAAALIPAIWAALASHDLPVALSELGASAGLNLAMDRFVLTVDGKAHGPADSLVQLRPDITGPCPAPRALRVTDRAGVDLHPLNPHDPAQALRLLAYLWPDQPDRLTLTRGAIALADTRPDAGDAAPWLAARLATRRTGTIHVIYHSIAWQYFPPATQSACTAALEAAGARATPNAPLAHIGMEADGTRGSAALSLRLWPDNPEPRMLARVDFHGRWLQFS